ncbi:hypothetical protein BOTBODRAFT_59024 [Botryobasidium botryosum FD-172 SS1]|uniref:Uncharacterized protein n=1 Tax=Botryobasidium botryosum (strain FD-172 SS1) TaxID=930990 RepID=A0A067M2N6_BOTB1|nr:hypothetical protein BOTBODRAFT_59024 [Botryobasidium botryosum FD-172 SS1]
MSKSKRKRTNTSLQLLTLPLSFPMVRYTVLSTPLGSLLSRGGTGTSTSTPAVNVCLSSPPLFPPFSAQPPAPHGPSPSPAPKVSPSHTLEGPLRLFHILTLARRSPAPIEESDDVEGEGETEEEDKAVIPPLNIPQPSVNAVQDQEIENLVVLFQALSLEDREDVIMADASECIAMDGIKFTSAQQDDARDRARRRVARRKVQVVSDMVPTKWTSGAASRRAISSAGRSIRARECGRMSVSRTSIWRKMQGIQQSMPEAASYESVQVSAYSPQVFRACLSLFTPPSAPVPSPPPHARAIVVSPGSPRAWTECFGLHIEWVITPMWSAPGVRVMA